MSDGLSFWMKRETKNSIFENGKFSQFLIVWLGQFISTMGSGISSFGLGVWVFEQTREVTSFAIIGVAAMTPALIIRPFIGAQVDKCSRKKILIIANIGPVLTTMIAYLLYSYDALMVWHIALVGAINSICAAFIWLSFTTSCTLMVAKKDLGRASGMVQAGSAVSQISAPFFAGALVDSFGLSPVLLINCGSYVAAIVTASIATIPSPEQKEEKMSALNSIMIGFRFIYQQKGLLALLCYFGIINFVIAVAIVIIQPLVLTMANAKVLGTLLSTAGIGMLTGSSIMSVWGGPKRKMPLILSIGLLVGIFGCVVGIHTDPFVLGVCGFLLLFSIPMVNASTQVIWQTKVPPEIQGRVFSVRMMVVSSAMPLAFLISGPLADRVFEPAMMPSGSLATIMGPYLGVGPGRGMGLMIFVSGCIPLLATAIAASFSSLRNLEREIPDAIDSPATEGTASTRNEVQ